MEYRKRRWFHFRASLAAILNSVIGFFFLILSILAYSVSLFWFNAITWYRVLNDDNRTVSYRPAYTNLMYLKQNLLLQYYWKSVTYKSTFSLKLAQQYHINAIKIQLTKAAIQPNTGPMCQLWALILAPSPAGRILGIHFVRPSVTQVNPFTLPA